MPTFFEAMISMSVTVQRHHRHLIFTVLNWLILKRGSINMKALVCVQHVWIQCWKSLEMSQSQNWYSIGGPKWGKRIVQHEISVTVMLVHNNGIYSVSNLRTGEQTASTWFLPHPKSNPRFCPLLFSKVDAEALQLRYAEAENEADAHRWRRQSTEPALHSAEDIHRTACLSPSNIEEGLLSANDCSLQLSCCLSFTLYNLADPHSPPQLFFTGSLG